jgi:hypothetical protein
MSEESFKKFSDRLNGIYDTVHPPDLDNIRNRFSDLRNMASTYFVNLAPNTDDEEGKNKKEN